MEFVFDRYDVSVVVMLYVVGELWSGESGN